MAQEDRGSHGDAEARAIADIEAMLAIREREEIAEEERPAPPVETFAPPPGLLASRVSRRAIDLIVEFETGGRTYYQKVIREHPIWPKARSGITIGFGYDLGYVRAASFNTDWLALAEADRAALSATIGAHGGNSSEARMLSLLAQVATIRIPWDLASSVFCGLTLPKWAATTYSALPHCDLLSADCFGALVSLTFNRGASYSLSHRPQSDPIDRYREMRQIKAAMEKRAFTEIPSLIRGMIRIWEGTAVATGMRRRRLAEAELFEAGLGVPAFAPIAAEATPAAVVAAETATSAGITVIAEDAEVSTAASDEEAFVDVGDDELSFEAARPGGSLRVALESTRVSWSTDSESLDYAHLGENLTLNAAFTFSDRELQLLADLNDFPVAEAGTTPLLFGLRGCLIVKDHESGNIVLRDVRPDHLTPRCVLGVWRRHSGEVFVFPGSTVPNAAAVNRWFTRRDVGNILPTGFYRYIVGAHNGKPGCFLLRKSAAEKWIVVVRRSSNNCRYDLTDVVDKMAPGDNIHPTFYSHPSGFSSVGCQTVVGTTTTAGKHGGPWAGFRAAAGESGAAGTVGKPYLYMLLTGAEARLAAELRIAGLAQDPLARRRLRRLRFGSQGSAVANMQRRLGLRRIDGKFGPGTAKALYDFQASLPPGGRCDGIFAPALDNALSWHVFGVIGV